MMLLEWIYDFDAGDLLYLVVIIFIILRWRSVTD